MHVHCFFSYAVPSAKRGAAESRQSAQSSRAAERGAAATNLRGVAEKQYYSDPVGHFCSLQLLLVWLAK